MTLAASLLAPRLSDKYSVDIVFYWSVPKTLFVFVQHLKIAKLVANTLKSR